MTTQVRVLQTQRMALRKALADVLKAAHNLDCARHSNRTTQADVRQAITSYEQAESFAREVLKQTKSTPKEN